jgi:hypothetical protein
MTRNLKVLGLALVAMVAMSAIVAQAAQAKFDTFRTYPGGNAFVKIGVDPTAPKQEITLVPGGFTLTCEAFSTTGATISDKATEVTGEPHYGNCKNSLGGEAELNSDGCHTKLTSETDANEHAEVHLICGSEAGATSPNGPGITLKTAGATITITGGQTLRGVHYSNTTTAPFFEQERHMEITISTTVEKQVHFTCSPAFTCGIAGIPTSGTEGTIKGKKTMSGKEDQEGQEGANSVGITVETLASSTMP